MNAPSALHHQPPVATGETGPSGVAANLFPRRILAPVDFSENGLHGVAYAAAFAQRFGASLSLVCVVDPIPWPLDGQWRPSAGDEAATVEEEMGTLVHGLATEGGLPQVSGEVRRGSPGIEVCQAAAHSGADLIIMSTHGYTALKQMLLRGITGAVVRHAPCPVLVVRSEPPEHALARSEAGHPLQRLLVPVDFSPTAERAIHYAVQLAQRCGAAVSLLHVIDPDMDEADGWSGGDFGGMKADAEARLRALMDRLVPEAAQGALYVRKGPTFAQIAAAADLVEADLLVITTHGRSGLSRLLLGSTAERVIRHCSSPVLVIHRAA